MYRLIPLLCLAVSACSTMPPQPANFPTPPELLMRPPYPLKTLPKPSQTTTVPADKLQSS